MTFTVDGEERAIRRSTRKGGQTYSVRIGEDARGPVKPVRIRHVYRTVAARSGHYLFIEVPQPARDLSLTFDYTAADVVRMNMMDLVSSSQRTRIARLPEQVGAKVISVDLSGWLLPRAGFTFVWTLPSEEAAPPAEANRAA